jgi:hypothetical protein
VEWLVTALAEYKLSIQVVPACIWCYQLNTCIYGRLPVLCSTCCTLLCAV